MEKALVFSVHGTVRISSLCPKDELWLNSFEEPVAMINITWYASNRIDCKPKKEIIVIFEENIGGSVFIVLQAKTSWL